MRTSFRRAILATTILCQILVAGGAALAQTAPLTGAAAAEADQPAGAGAEQIALTEKQIRGLIAARGAIDAIIEKIPADRRDAPDAKVQAALDAAAKAFGFADYGEVDAVGGNVAFVLDGFDRRKKTFVGHEAVIKMEIAEVGADTTLSPKDRDAEIKRLTAILPNVEAEKFPGNVALVTKYFDALADIFPDED